MRKFFTFIILVGIYAGLLLQIIFLYKEKNVLGTLSMIWIFIIFLVPLFAGFGNNQSPYSH